MSYDNVCRLLLELKPNRGSWNMAVDEALLEAAVERGQCALRWYRWEQATLSLGYFQPTAAAGNSSLAGLPPEFSGLPVVRRLSGGGAILHHHELTYSCALPASHPLSKSPSELYARIHQGLIAVLRHHDVPAMMRGPVIPGVDAAFLCFNRSDPRDIVCQKHKIVGSAQRRRRGAVLQHGSILWARSHHAPRFPGIQDLISGIPPLETIAVDFADAVAAILAPHNIRESLSATDADRAMILERERYCRQD